MNTSILILCDGILCPSQAKLEMPDGWSSRLGEMHYGGDASYMFCPTCKGQGDWFGAVCPGCFESYSDCRFAKAFMFDSSPGLTDSQKQEIRAGHCPFRSNGTMAYYVKDGVATPHDIDLSEQAPQGSGDAIVMAVEQYQARYSIPREAQ